MLMLSYLLPIRWQGHTVVSDHTVSNLSPTTPNHTCNYNINILVGLGQHFIQQRWSGNHKLARTIPFIQTMQLINSKIPVPKPHSGVIVLMLSYLLPIRWQCHTVVSDHTVSNISPTTPNNTCNYNINILVGLGQHFIQQRWRETLNLLGLSLLSKLCS